MSIASIIDNDPENYPYSLDQLIKPGARVYVHKLYDAAAGNSKSKAKATTKSNLAATR